MRGAVAARIAMACAVVAIVGTVATCGEAASPKASQAPPSGTVVLGIYSGRPDPSWDLSPAQTAELARRIDALPIAVGGPPEGGLGYHGFTIVLRVAGEADRTLVAYRGTVTPPGTEAPPGTGAPAYLDDPERSIERFLLETGRAHLAAPEIAELEANLATL